MKMNYGDYSYLKRKMRKEKQILLHNKAGREILLDKVYIQNDTGREGYTNLEICVPPMKSMGSVST